jgi:hypothetical protein
MAFRSCVPSLPEAATPRQPGPHFAAIPVREPRLPIGKHKGRTLAVVLQEEPSYLCWFVETVEGCEDIKQAILALPGFREEQAKHYERKHRKEASVQKLVEETVCQALGAEGPTRQGTGDLYERLFRSWN